MSVSIHLSIYLSICLSVCLSIYLSIYIHIYSRIGEKHSASRRLVLGWQFSDPFSAFHTTISLPLARSFSRGFLKSKLLFFGNLCRANSILLHKRILDYYTSKFLWSTCFLLYEKTPEKYIDSFLKLFVSWKSTMFIATGKVTLNLWYSISR